jgi:hypothetical protein
VEIARSEHPRERSIDVVQLLRFAGLGSAASDALTGTGTGWSEASRGRAGTVFAQPYASIVIIAEAAKK